MKKSIFMAASASILLTGCLVKKSDYEAEQAAHKATQQELLKINEELSAASTELNGKSADLQKVQDELSSLRAELSKSRMALIVAQQEAQSLKAESATSFERAIELADRLSVADKKVAEAEELYAQRMQDLKAKDDAELEVLKAKNEQMRRFMLSNFSNAEFLNAGDNAVQEAAPIVVAKKASESAVEAATEEVATPAERKRWAFWGKKAAETSDMEEAPVAIDAPAAEEMVEESVVEESADMGKRSWWDNFWGKKADKAPAATSVESFEVKSYKDSLNALDEKAAAKEAMRMMGEQTDSESVAQLSTQLMSEAVATADELIIKWVSVAVIKGAGENREVAKGSVEAAVSGTPYQEMVAQLLDQ